MINGCKICRLKMADSKMEDESKMNNDILKTCINGPLEELKNTINSSNINSRNYSEYGV